MINNWKAKRLKDLEESIDKIPSMNAIDRDQLCINSKWCYEHGIITKELHNKIMTKIINCNNQLDGGEGELV